MKGSRASVTRWVCQTIDQCVVLTVFCQKLMPNFLIEKRFEIIFAIYVIFKKTAQRKHSLNRQKIFPSGRPDCNDLVHVSRMYYVLWNKIMNVHCSSIKYESKVDTKLPGAFLNVWFQESSKFTYYLNYWSKCGRSTRLAFIVADQLVWFNRFSSFAADQTISAQLAVVVVTPA
jgi:hypothetical protein